MAFGLRYFAELQSKFKGAFWRVEIAERSYAGATEEMTFDGSNPLSITWERRGDEFYVPIKASEANVDILCTENFRYIGLFTSDPRRYRVSVFRNAALYWRGYVVADLYSEGFTAPPYLVSIKAVDGFNLLQSIPFTNPDGTQIAGRKSLWDLLYSCIELLELELDVADWMDLYAEGMDEKLSPMRQVCVDMERFYAVYENPSYRDVLELCLRPFAGQMFQSNGALHIRRAVSLYRETRPLSFYDIGTKFPSGFLITADGRELLTDTGQNIVTEATRERIEDMWAEGFDVMGDSMMDIVPPLRKVTVSVKNKMMANLMGQFGYYDLSKWSDPYEFLSMRNATSLQLMGDSSRQGTAVTLRSWPVQQCTYALKWEFVLRAYFRQWGSSSRSSYFREYTFKPEYGIKIVGNDTGRTVWLTDDGFWSTGETHIYDEVKTSNESNRKIEISGIPISGDMIFYIRQTLKSSGNTSYGSSEAVEFCNMSLTIDTGDDYENSLSYDVMVNHANNVDMSISLPIADIPNIPNDRLIYSLYFTDTAGKPTRMWRTRGGNDYNTLINHLVQCALRYKQLPSRRIGGEMFTGRHVDMNSVVQDNKYLRAGFYVNSIELKALDDSYNSELVEMPGLVRTESPPIGDDCLQYVLMDFTVKTALRCANIIALLSTDNRIFAFDTASRQLRLLLSYTQTVDIYPADNAFVVVDGAGVSLVDYRGVVMKRWNQAGYGNPATYMDGYFYVITSYVDPRDGRLRYYVNRPGYVYVSATYRRGAGSTLTVPSLPISILKSFSAIVLNFAERSLIHDKRINEELGVTVMPDGTEIKTISDYFMAENLGGNFRIYRRDTITERTLIKSIAGKADLADHTLGEVAYSSAGTIYIWTYLNNTVRQLRNTAGAHRALKGLFYINGELYIVRDNAIYKYIP